MRKSFLAILLLLSGIDLLFADPSVSVKVSATEMTMDSSITLLLEIVGVKNVGSPPSLQLPDFQTQSAGQTSSFQWVNGQSNSLVTFNYLLTPTRAGSLTIPSITLNIDGKSYNSEPIVITVRNSGSQGGQQGSPTDTNTESAQGNESKPLFLTATLDTKKIYVGQQVTLKIQFYRRPEVRMASQARYNEPNLTGFLAETLPQQEYTTTIKGFRYNVTEIPYALFPTSEGDFKIGAASVELAVQAQINQMDPNSFFQSFFGRNEVVRLESIPIQVRVRALPTPKPSTFSGGVGKFRLTAKLDSAKPEVGKPLNLIFNLEGVGNIKSLKEPILPELKGFRRYETISNSKISKEKNILSGTKEFKILLVPQVSGGLQIPSAQFSFFNPQEGEYETVSTPPIEVQVDQGTIDTQGTDFPLSKSRPDQAMQGVQVIDKDIRFIKNGSVRKGSPPLFLQGGILLLNIFPPLFALVAFLAKIQIKRRVVNATGYRSKEAYSKARKKLSRAKSKMTDSDPVEFYENIHSALAGYLADKLTLAEAGLVSSEINRKLAEANISEETRNRLLNLLDTTDMARFGSISLAELSIPDTLKTTTQLLKELDKSL